jgi:hypothetical protein
VIDQFSTYSMPDFWGHFSGKAGREFQSTIWKDNVLN